MRQARVVVESLIPEQKVVFNFQTALWQCHAQLAVGRAPTSRCDSWLGPWVTGSIGFTARESGLLPHESGEGGVRGDERKEEGND
ncbi:hypothetical protein J6590_061568 [Homalodisca vitripennis]|nr:hypothetical protein J6590_061568 [Homalodisca vitripennis]